MLDRREFSRPALVRRLVREARGAGALILEGNVGLQQGYTDLLASALIARRRRRPVVVLSEVSWETGSRRLGRILGNLQSRGEDRLPLERTARRAVRALDSPQTYYCVLARAEQDIFPSVWGVDPARVIFTPFFHMMPDGGDDSSSDGSVFAGGESLRDYEPLVTAAPSVPATIRIATSRLDGRALPSNVEAGRVPSTEYYPTMRRARVVVVPLATGRVRCAGMLTYLNAMALGKCVIVTDSLGVRDYVEDGRTGLVVPEGDARGLAEALRWALDPANAAQVDLIAARARAHVRTHFTIDAHLRRLLAVAEAAMDARQERRRRRQRRGR